MSRIIILDPGHGGSDPGAVGNGLKEKDLNLVISLATRDALADYDCTVKLTRTKDVYVALSTRAAMGKSADLFVSQHNNAFTSDVRGFETYCHSGPLRPETLGYRDALHAAVYPYLRSLGVPDRGKRRYDHYITRMPPCPTVLMEYLYVTNVADAALLKKSAVLKELGRLTAVGIANALNLKRKTYTAPEPDTPGTPILGAAEATVGQAQDWATKMGAHQRFVDIAPLYWHYGLLTGIRPEALYVQSAKETAYGKYGGAVTPDQNNWAGIKIQNPVGDRREDHQSFATPDDGVRAHFNHMCAYVGLKPVGTPHGRYYVVQDLSWAGTVKDVEELGGKWAPSATYGQDIVKMLEGLLATPAPAEPELPPVEPEPVEPEPELPEEPEPPEESPKTLADFLEWLIEFLTNYLRRIKT
ncbi:MAG: N-acetylmuramoyl-L-alanine amidase [Advenella sp.]